LHARYGLVLAGGAAYLWQQQAMQNSGQGTDEATAISAGDTNNSGASNGGDPDDDDPEEARRPKTGKSDRHGDKNAMSKAEKQIEELKEDLKNATSRREPQQIEQKINNITQIAQRNAKAKLSG
jgi:hypothetical protein